MTSFISRRETQPGLTGLHRLNRLLDEAFTGWPFAAEQGDVITSAWFAATDVSESPDHLRITMELPGVRPEDVKISLENNILTIRGEKRQEVEANNERVHRYERSYGFFERTFALPNTVDPEKINANYENGVLTITIPKAERAKPREIPVSAGQGATEIRSTGSAGTQSGTQSRASERAGSTAKTSR
jgi:HSP20 family protein